MQMCLSRVRGVRGCDFEPVVQFLVPLHLGTVNRHTCMGRGLGLFSTLFYNINIVL